MITSIFQPDRLSWTRDDRAQNVTTENRTRPWNTAWATAHPADTSYFLANGWMVSLCPYQCPWAQKRVLVDDPKPDVAKAAWSARHRGLVHAHEGYRFPCLSTAERRNARCGFILN